MKHSSRINRNEKSSSAESVRRVMLASSFWWLVALIFLAGVASVIPAKIKLPFWVLVRDYDPTAGMVGISVLAGAWAMSSRISWDFARISYWIERHLLALCLGAFAFYAALSFWPYHHYPLAMDEYGPFMQSRAFAAGQISAWVPPSLLDWVISHGFRGEFFSVSESSGRYVSVYWPGLAISQVPFAFFHATWLCNPAWGALGLWGVHRLTQRLTGSSEAAAWAWVLMLASPVVAINAASLYSMPAHLTCNIFYCLLLLRGERRSAFWAGVVGGFALVLHNPVPHAAFALPWIVLIARKERRLLGPLLLGYLVLALPLGLGWSVFLKTNFDASKYAHLAPSSGALSPFAETLGRLAMLVKWPDFLLIMARLTGVAKTVVWAVPGLLVVAWQGWRGLKTPTPDAKTNRRGLRLLALSLFWTFLIYWQVPFDQGHGWGFRYVHSAWFALVVLGALFISRAPEKSALRPFFAALCALSFAVLLPLRAWQAENFIARHQAQVPAPTTSTASASITFINTKHGWLTADLVQNDPFLRNEDWRFLSHGAARNAQLAREYLVNPKREQNGEWGEIWSGSALRHPIKK